MRRPRLSGPRLSATAWLRCWLVNPAYTARLYGGTTQWTQWAWEDRHA